MSPAAASSSLKRAAVSRASRWRVCWPRMPRPPPSIRSRQSDAVNHVGGVCEMNTGDILAGRPSLGAWVTYGLGSAQRNLPTFIVMQDDKEILGSVQNYGSGFLPATYQGTLFRQGDTPILNLKPPLGTTDPQQRGKIELLEKLNALYARNKEEDTELD